VYMLQPNNIVYHKNPNKCQLISSYYCILSYQLIAIVIKMNKIEIFTRGIEITVVFILGLLEGNFPLESQIPPKMFTLYTCKTIKSALKFILRESS